MGAAAASGAFANTGERAAAPPGRLAARPAQGRTAPALLPGEHALGLGKRRDGLVFVPRQQRNPLAPLVVMLHGATGSGKGVTARTTAFELAEEFGVVVLAPDSRQTTWDMISGFAGPDVAFVNAALEQTFAQVSVDPRRLAIGGFSDGASYALSLGLINGDLFTHVMAFSPGFIVARQVIGLPAIFISHGTRDDILPINDTSRRLVPGLQKAGYAVRYREFTGPHTVPPAIVHEAFEWMTSPRP
jgi:phospholipase/carboxylesterase